MYIRRVPHPLAHFTRELDSTPDLDALQAASTNDIPSISQQKPHATAYVILAIVLVLLLLGLIGVFIARRRAVSLLPCIAKRTKINEKLEAPRMQREGRSRFTDGFENLPTLTARGSVSSRAPSSACSDGPSTPSAGEEHDHGDLGTNGTNYPKDECSFVPIPIIVHTPTQTHQTTFLTGPDITTPDFIAPTAHHEHFFDEHVPTTLHGSVIRPHGLPLSPVPEESSAILSFSTPYFEVDEETLYGSTQDQHPTQ
ncbi:hypothetical protein K439DRAFT_615495 [Ramaria rubella]|nr:hypothetical protein K439DRAFT_615495 [Ramaria rubella]